MHSRWLPVALLFNQILIQDGRPPKGALRRHCVSDADLLEDLRLKCCESPNEVKCARLEANGDLSVISKKPK